MGRSSLGLRAGSGVEEGGDHGTQKGFEASQEQVEVVDGGEDGVGAAGRASAGGEPA